jgi:hypothetical protein
MVEYLGGGIMHSFIQPLFANQQVVREATLNAIYRFVCTSHESQYVSATEPSRLMLCKI